METTPKGCIHPVDEVSRKSHNRAGLKEGSSHVRRVSSNL